MARETLNSMEHNGSDDRRLRREIARQGRTDYVNVGATERIASAVAGGFLTMFGLRRRGTVGYGMALLGAEMLYRGASGHCKTYSMLGVSTKEYVEPGVPAEVDHERSISVRQSVYVERPREELFAMWRDFSRLPLFMDHLERVEVISPTHSHWVVAGPAGSKVEWDAEIVDERENEWIAWRTVEPAQVPNNGTVMFCEMSDGGTDVFVTLEAQPPAGKFGDLVARMFGRAPNRQVRKALERFKEMAEGRITPELSV
ncbi:SRPBCC family protein [Gemmatimonas sp.]|uniref:SRPBCC family protein n=1 Tax=Gemmatimonas sp. TaxID=1962908 RepID=UPI00286E9610|nr:SRPBCC family protein [Gemmatimonas sp.]